MKRVLASVLLAVVIAILVVQVVHMLGGQIKTTVGQYHERCAGLRRECEASGNNEFQCKSILSHVWRCEWEEK